MKHSTDYNPVGSPWVRAFIRALRRPDTRTPLQQHGAAMLRGERPQRLVFELQGGRR